MHDRTAALPGHAFQQSHLLISSISCPHTSCFSGSARHTELLFCQLRAPRSISCITQITPCQQRPVLLNCLLPPLRGFHEITAGSQPPFSSFPSLFATYQPTAEPHNPQALDKNTHLTCSPLRSIHSNATLTGKASLPVGQKISGINFIQKTKQNTTTHYFQGLNDP